MTPIPASPEWLIARRDEFLRQISDLESRIKQVKTDFLAANASFARLQAFVNRLPGTAELGDPMLRIKLEVAVHFGFTVHDLEARDRHESVVWARHVAMFLCRQLTRFSLHQIGAAFGGRDHATVSNALQNVRDRLEVEPNRRPDLDLLTATVRAALSQSHSSYPSH